MKPKLHLVLAPTASAFLAWRNQFDACHHGSFRLVTSEVQLNGLRPDQYAVVLHLLPGWQQTNAARYGSRMIEWLLDHGAEVRVDVEEVRRQVCRAGGREHEPVAENRLNALRLNALRDRFFRRDQRAI